MRRVAIAVSAALAWWKRGVWAPVAGQLVWQVYLLAATCGRRGSFPGPDGTSRRMQRNSQLWSRADGISANLAVPWTWSIPLLVGRSVVRKRWLLWRSLCGSRNLWGQSGWLPDEWRSPPLPGCNMIASNFFMLEKALLLSTVGLGPLLCRFSVAWPLRRAPFSGRALDA